MGRRTSEHTVHKAARVAEPVRAQTERVCRKLEAMLDTRRVELEAANARLEETAQELKHARDRYTELYDSVPLAFLTLDRNGRITELNPPAAALLHSARESLLYRPLLVHVEKEDRPRFSEHLIRCRNSSGPVLTELRLRRADGASIPVEISSRCGARANADEYPTLIADITERTQARDLLQRTERLAALGMLTADMAHEVKSPLHSILLSTQMLHRQTAQALTEEQREMLAAIVDDVHRCSRIIKNMLLFARNEPTEKWPSDLNLLLRHSVGVVQASGVMCETELRLAQPSPRIRANPTEIDQVIVNLLNNAAEAAEGKCRIEIETRQVNGRAVLTIRDNGPGIAREHLPRIFDPFYTTRRARGGTGLGLSVVHMIVTEHEGSIRVESEPGHGTCFVLTFPLAPDVERS